VARSTGVGGVRDRMIFKVAMNKKSKEVPEDLKSRGYISSSLVVDDRSIENLWFTLEAADSGDVLGDLSFCLYVPVV
jgi:ribosomal protein S8